MRGRIYFLTQETVPFSGAVKAEPPRLSHQQLADMCLTSLFEIDWTVESMQFHPTSLSTSSVVILWSLLVKVP